MEYNILHEIKYFMSNNLDPSWVIKGKFLMYKKYEHIPVCYVEDGVVYVFLDAKISKNIIKLTQKLDKDNTEFYFTTPSMSNPKGIYSDEYHDSIIKHYLISYCNKDFYYGFKKIGYDLIDNMVKWTEKEKCFNSIKYNLEIVKKRIIYDYQCDDTIREDFNTLYRHIVISKFV